VPGSLASRAPRRARISIAAAAAVFIGMLHAVLAAPAPPPAASGPPGGTGTMAPALRPAAAPAGAAARHETPDPFACVAKAKETLARTKEEDERARGSILAGLRDCLRAILDGREEQNALVVARAAHEMFPAEPRAGFDYGAVLMLAKGDPALARTVLEKALAQKPRLAPTTTAERALAIGNLGKLALERGDTAAAREQLKQALTLDASHVGFLYDLVAADRKAADAEACRDHLLAALQQDPEASTRDDYLIGAWAFTHLDRPSEAAMLLRKGIERLPNASGLHLNLGYALAVDGRPVEALLEYRYEILNGASDDAYVTQARRQYEDAVGRAQATPQHATAITRVRSIFDPAAEPGKILADVDALEGSGYHHATLDLARAEALYASKDVTGSEAVLRKLLTADAAFLPAYFDLSVILRGTGKDDEARRLVAEAVKRNPRHWQLTGSGSESDGG